MFYLLSVSPKTLPSTQLRTPKDTGPLTANNIAAHSISIVLLLSRGNFRSASCREGSSYTFFFIRDCLLGTFTRPPSLLCSFLAPFQRNDCNTARVLHSLLFSARASVAARLPASLSCRVDIKTSLILPRVLPSNCPH